MSVELTINVHDSYSDCEMCGSYSNDILSVHSDSHRNFGEYHSGTSAHCYDVEEANYYEFCNEILNRLESIGCGIPCPEWKPRPVNEELEQRYKTAIIDRGLLDRTVHPTWATWPKDTDWDTYWEYGYYSEKEFEDAYYVFFENALDENNPGSFISYLRQHGVQVELTSSEDERYDAYRWEDDDYEEYDESDDDYTFDDEEQEED